MQNKTIITNALLIMTFILAGAGCVSTPEDNVDRLEQEKAEKLESSGYNECMARIEARTTEHEQCVVNKIIADGYSDGLDCVGNYENPICKDTTRYNAQVDAYNECNDEIKDSTTDLSMVDCLKLLEE